MHFICTFLVSIGFHSVKVVSVQSRRLIARLFNWTPGAAARGLQYFQPGPYTATNTIHRIPERKYPNVSTLVNEQATIVLFFAIYFTCTTAREKIIYIWFFLFCFYSKNKASKNIWIVRAPPQKYYNRTVYESFFAYRKIMKNVNDNFWKVKFIESYCAAVSHDFTFRVTQL